MDLLHTIIKSTNFTKIQRKNMTCFINLMVFYNPTTTPPKKQDDHNITMWAVSFFHMLGGIPYRAPKIQIAIGKAGTRPCPQIHGAFAYFCRSMDGGFCMVNVGIYEILWVMNHQWVKNDGVQNFSQKKI